MRCRYSADEVQARCAHVHACCWGVVCYVDTINRQSSRPYFVFNGYTAAPDRAHAITFVRAVRRHLTVQQYYSSIDSLTVGLRTQ